MEKKQVIILIMCIILFTSNIYAQNKIYLMWDSSPSDIAGYIIHYGTVSGDYSGKKTVGNVLTDSVKNLSDNVRYFFAVTAIDSMGNESIYSNEVDTIIVTTPVLPGDKNGDGIVDLWDQILFDKAFGYTSTHLLFDPFFDFNNDNIIDFFDQIKFDSYFGTSIN